ncbi:hypothetical protein AVEN_77220-1 [Araneus ventricosus]|uniref:Uncharacterized protein n=1 Tax=Araneus ventricosus TaxID=182803 RepID=A0A4Y2SDC6_ARAVE|nr:hypothetical protein AVEN_77220-1 [Araneus ventricosus]
MAFRSDRMAVYTIPLSCSGVLYLSFLLFIIIAACIANEGAQEVTHSVRGLPYQFSDNRDFRSMCKQTLNQACNLTLWKMYSLDRSLVVLSLGTLPTYVILLGTLGKTEEDIKKID